MRVKNALLGAAAAAVLVAGIPVPAAATSAGPQLFTIVVQQASAQEQPTFSRVVATGVINDVGTDVFLTSPPDDPAASYSRYELTRGTLSVRNLPEQFDLDVNPRSCVVKVRASGTWEVLTGTGQYAGAEGRGTLTLTGRGLLARGPDGCSEAEGTFSAVIRISAVVMLPT